MSRLYQYCVDPGAHEYAVKAACFDLHLSYVTDADCRKALNNPTTLMEIRKSLGQLESIARKIEWALASSGVCREARQDEPQKVPV